MPIAFLRLAATPLLLASLALPAHGHSQTTPQQVTLAQFRELRWLEGTWLGSGGSYPAFYEEYRVVNDSTIRMSAFADSTFQQPTDSSWIELRAGTVTKRRARPQYVAIAVSPRAIRFRPSGASAGGFTFSRVTPDQWTATLHPVAPGGRETVYIMRRLGP